MAKKSSKKPVSVDQKITQTQKKLDQLHQCLKLLAADGIEADHSDREQEFKLQQHLRTLTAKKNKKIRSKQVSKQAQKKVGSRRYRAEQRSKEATS